MAAEVTTYIYQGCAYGQFENNRGQMVDFFNIYVTSEFPQYNMKNYHAEGYKAEKFSCLNGDVLRLGELVQGDYIRLYFDQKSRVCLIVDANE